MRNSDIISGIRQGRKEVLEEVYKQNRLPFIEWLSKTQQIPIDEATEIYQQTIVVFYENIMNGKLIELKSNIKTYLFAIGKNKVSEYRRKRAKKTTIADYHVYKDEDNIEEKDKQEKMIELSKKCLELIGDPCRKLLELYYYHKRSMSQIANELGYKNENSTKNQKYKCLEKLRVMFKTKIRKEPQLDYGI